MTGLALLIPVALGLGLAGLAAFFWALSRGQFDDMDGAALRIFIEDENGTMPGVELRVAQPSASAPQGDRIDHAD